MFQATQGRYGAYLRQITMDSFQQMQLLSVMLILVLALAQFTCTLLAATAERLASLTAQKFAQIFTVCKATQWMLE